MRHGLTDWTRQQRAHIGLHKPRFAVQQGGFKGCLKGPDAGARIDAAVAGIDRYRHKLHADIAEGLIAAFFRLIGHVGIERQQAVVGAQQKGMFVFLDGAAQYDISSCSGGCRDYPFERRRQTSETAFSTSAARGRSLIPAIFVRHLPMGMSMRTALLSPTACAMAGESSPSME